MVDTDRPVSLSIDKVDRVGIYLSNPEDYLVHPEPGMGSTISRIRGHPFTDWNVLTPGFSTNLEMHCLYRRLDYPSSNKLMKLLEQLGISNIRSGTRKR